MYARSTVHVASSRQGFMTPDRYKTPQVYAGDSRSDRPRLFSPTMPARGMNYAVDSLSLSGNTSFLVKVRFTQKRKLL